MSLLQLLQHRSRSICQVEEMDKLYELGHGRQ
jgi:hypothetical protein